MERSFELPGPADPLVLTLERGGIVRGTVRAPTGAPCPDARVYAVSIQEDTVDLRRMAPERPTREIAFVASTDSAGSYEIGGLPLPAYFRIVAEGCGGARGASEKTELSADAEVVTLDVDLFPRTTLVVRPVRADGKPLTSPTRMGLHGEFMGFAGERRTKGVIEEVMPNESVRFPGLGPGDYRILLEAEDSLPTWVPVTVSAPGEQELTVHGAGGLSIVGTVVDTSDRPVRGASVLYYVAPDRPDLVDPDEPEVPGFEQTRMVSTNDAGEFLIEGLQDLEGSLWVSSDPWHSREGLPVRPGRDPVRVVIEPAER